MFTKIDHILGHKTSLNTFKMIQIMMSSDHNGIKLEINNISGKSPKISKLYNTYI